MKEPFETLLAKYRAGELDNEQRAEIKAELDKHRAIADFLAEADDELWSEMKEIQPKAEIEKTVRRAKRSTVIKITKISVCVVMAFVLLFFGIFATSRIATEFFDLSEEERVVQSEALRECITTFFPNYTIDVGSDGKKEVESQIIRETVNDKLGHEIIEKKQIEVNYQMGKVKGTSETLYPELFLSTVDPFDLGASYDKKDWVKEKEIALASLKTAPNSATARIFVEFVRRIEPMEMSEKIVPMDTKMGVMSCEDIPGLERRADIL